MAFAQEFFAAAKLSDPGFQARDVFRWVLASTTAVRRPLRLSALFPRRMIRARRTDLDATLLPHTRAFAEPRKSP